MATIGRFRAAPRSVPRPRAALRHDEKSGEFGQFPVERRLRAILDGLRERTRSTRPDARPESVGAVPSSRSWIPGRHCAALRSPERSAGRGTPAQRRRGPAVRESPRRSRSRPPHTTAGPRPSSPASAPAGHRATPIHTAWRVCPPDRETGACSRRAATRGPPPRTRRQCDARARRSPAPRAMRRASIESNIFSSANSGPGW